MGLTLAEIKKRRNAARPTVDVPEWGDDPFHVAPVSTKTALEVLKIQRRLCPGLPDGADPATAEATFAAALADNADDLVEFYVLLISKCLANEAGERTFDCFDGRDFIRAESLPLLQRVAGDVQRLNGFDRAEDPAKNSPATPVASSCSSSPPISASGTSTASPAE